MTFHFVYLFWGRWSGLSCSLLYPYHLSLASSRWSVNHGEWLSKGRDTWKQSPPTCLEQGHLQGWGLRVFPRLHISQFCLYCFWVGELISHGSFWWSFVKSEESGICPLPAGKSHTPGGCSSPGTALESPGTQVWPQLLRDFSRHWSAEDVILFSRDLDSVIIIMVMLLTHCLLKIPLYGRPTLGKSFDPNALSHLLQEI